MPSSARFGAIADTELFQIKGAGYSLLDLLGDPALVEAHRNGRFVTLRLTSSMYHRFHAPSDCRIEQVTFISGDTWNVNPIALKRVERLFCKNERAVIRTGPGQRRNPDPGAGRGHSGRKYPAAFSGYRAQCGNAGADHVSLRCKRPQRRRTRLVRARIDDHRADARQFEFCDNVSEGARIIAGQPLLRKSPMPERDPVDAKA